MFPYGMSNDGSIMATIRKRYIITLLNMTLAEDLDILFVLEDEVITAGV